MTEVKESDEASFKLSGAGGMKGYEGSQQCNTTGHVTFQAIRDGHTLRAALTRNIVHNTSSIIIS